MEARRMVALVGWLYAPLMLLGWNGAALGLVGAGAPLWSLGVMLLGAVATSFVVERVAPYERRWNASIGDRGRDVAHAIVNELANALALAAIPAFAATHPGAGVWPHAWPLVLQLLVAILVADAGITLAHRASHRVGWLWRFHAVHHSVERMYGLNGLMKHPVHQAIEGIAGTTPLLLAGMPVEVAALLAFAIAVQLLLQHANVDVRLGPFARVLALAPAHRFHHQRAAGVGDVNFGLFTCLWDRVLGTAVWDGARRFEPGDFGIADRPDYPRAYLAQLAEPFRAARGVAPRP